MKLGSSRSEPRAARRRRCRLQASEFLRDLRREIEEHPAVNHVFLMRVGTTPFTREDYRVFGLNHYPLVGTFCRYMEHLLLRAPDSESKSWIAKVLVDEYGEGSDGEDHAHLYRKYLTACGVGPGEEDQEPLDSRVAEFIREHMRIVTEEPFLVGLGALGPGHEWAIPKMFVPIIDGLRRAGFTEREIVYFTLHTMQDQDHGRWLEEALSIMVRTPNRRLRCAAARCCRWRPGASSGTAYSPASCGGGNRCTFGMCGSGCACGPGAISPASRSSVRRLARGSPFIGRRFGRRPGWSRRRGRVGWAIAGSRSRGQGG